ncbi:MAG TPA: hypothetical protein VFA66_07420 [Gaiellaceae bacterium]|nr:hypothetical protein [Gaiellaceae bacterium]
MLLALVTLGALVSVTAAQAQAVTNEAVEYGYSGFVPCANGGAGELVNGTIEMHILITSTVNGDVDSSQFEFQPRGSLVGAVSGDAYRLTGLTRGSYQETLQNGANSLTYVSVYHLIGPGQENNLLVREIAHITRHGDDVVVEHDNFTIECS